MSGLNTDALQQAFARHDIEHHDVLPDDVIPVPDQCLADLKRWYDETMNATDSADFFCVCSEDMCFCTNKVPGVEMACTTCARGEHVWQMP